MLALARRDAGVIVQDNQGAVECASAEAAVRLAEAMAHTPGYVAAMAFARTGRSAPGQYGPAAVVKSAAFWCPERQAWVN